MTGPSGDETYSLEELVIPDRPSRPVTPAISSHAQQIGAALYQRDRAVLSGDKPALCRQQKGTGDTYCNIFVWDVTSAMGAQIPAYYL